MPYARLIQCRNCGLDAEHRGRGLCPACYAYWRRHGLPRPWVENVVLERIRLVREGVPCVA